MNKRVTIVTVLVILVIGGLFSGIFAGTIQQALTLPMLQTMMGTGTQVRQPAVAVAKPTATKSAANNPTLPTVMPLAQDTFKRPNQSFWGTSSDQRMWEGDANLQQAFSIANASGQIAHNQGTFNALLGPTETNTDVMMSAMINQFGDGVNFGAVLRLTNNGNNFYKAFVDGTTLSLIKHVNGDSTVLLSKPFKAQGNILYNLHFRAVGGMLFANVWPGGTTEPKQWMIVASDTTFAAGQDGVRVVVKPTTVINVTTFIVTAASLAGEQ